jgi:hypothetical protein
MDRNCIYKENRPMIYGLYFLAQFKLVVNCKEDQFATQLGEVTLLAKSLSGEILGFTRSLLSAVGLKLA